MFFEKKKFIWCIFIFLPFRPFFIVWLSQVKLSQATVNWILKQSVHDFFHDYYWILKQSWLGFLNSEDMISQENIYVVDIVWILCDVLSGGQNSRFCKASLRICYISLFESKGPWMLKAVINCHVSNRGLQKLDWKSTMCSVVKLFHTFVFNIFSVFNTLYLHN